MKVRLIGFLMFLLSLGVLAQEKTLTGSVKDEQGLGLPGVAVLIKGKSVGTQTDFDGNYSIRATAGDVLVYSYIGMLTQERTVGTSNTIDVVLREDTQVLDEVVVIGYGTAKKSTFAGAASVVTSEQIENRAVTSVTSALEGSTTGVQMTSALGQPGESPTVRIRGFGSVNASNSPLYVVDGVIYNNDISLINSNDIESVTVLKDAVSTAIYGSSAGNGVVLITTKKGKSDRSNINLSVTTGMSNRAYDDYKKVGVYDYIPVQWMMMKNALVAQGQTEANAATRASAEVIGQLGGYNPFAGIANGDVITSSGLLNPNATQLKWGDDLDWEKAAFSTGYRQEYNLNYNVKTDKSDTFASVGYLDEEGYMLRTGFERLSGRLNYNTYSKEWFKTGLNIGASRANSNYSTSTQSNSSGYSNLTAFVRGMAPIYPLHRHDLTTGAYLDADGNVVTNPNHYTYDYLGGRLSSPGRDGIAEALLNTRNTAVTNVSAATYFTLIPVKGLSITANYYWTNNDLRRKVYENPLVGDGSPAGRLAISSTRTLTKTFNQLINYTKEFGKHNFDLLLGHENYDYSYEYLYANRNQEIISGIYEFSNFVNPLTSSSYTDNYKKEGYFSRLSYDYDDTYTLTASFRRDGSSRFSKENRWGNFFSVGGSWILSRENFLQSATWINMLKLRVSWGQTGNDMILDSDGYASYYPYQTMYDLGVNNGTESGVYFSSMANNNLKWETQVSSDIALEFALFGKLTGTVEYFNKASKDLLFDVSIASSNGVGSVIQNIGKLENRGFEIELDYKIINNGNWKASVGANASLIKNEIISLPESNRENGIISGSKRFMEGRSIYDFWLRQWWGVNPANGDGLYVFDSDTYNATAGNLTPAIQNTIVEIDGQQLTNSHSYAKFDWSGSTIPKVYGGFNFKVGYKALELSTVFSYALGGKVLDNAYTNLMSTGSYGTSMHADLLDAWKQPGDITSVPRLDATSGYNTSVGTAYSTRWLTNADYLNFRSATLSCKLPDYMIESLQLSSVGVNLTAENIFLFTKRQGLNPQGNYSGITYNTYIPARIISIGVNVAF